MGHYRMVDGNDVVTRVPPGLLFYAHSGRRYQVSQEGVSMSPSRSERAEVTEEVERDLQCLAGLRLPVGLDAEPPPDLYDHSTGCYGNRMWNAL